MPKLKNKTILVVLAGGGHGRQCKLILNHLKLRVNLIFTRPSFVTAEDFGIESEEFERSSILLPDLQTMTTGTKFTSFISGIKIFYMSISFILKYKPDCVVGIASRECVFVLAAARLLNVETCFIESITRVNQPSFTLRLISFFHLSKHIFVQWPELVSKIKNAKYKGRVI